MMSILKKFFLDKYLNFGAFALLIGSIADIYQKGYLISKLLRYCQLGN
jgi:hypothetical protein